MGRVTTSDGAPSSEEAQRAAAIVAALGKNAGSEDVFAAFEELDALPAEVVRSVLTPWTGPAPDPEQLDPATRKAHGFPPLPLEVHTIRIVKPKRIEDLGRVAQEQVRVAGMAWDGQDLHATARLATDGSESSFAGTLEHRVVSDEDGKPLFDVLLYAGDSGTIFRAGTTDVVGAVAYGTVELKDRRARVALQASLTTTEAEVVTPKAKPEPEPRVVAAREPEPTAAVATRREDEAEEPVEGEEEEEEVAISSEAPTKRVLATKATGTAKKKAAATKKTAAKKSAAPAKKKAAATKKTTAKKSAAPAKKTATTKKTAAKKSAATTTKKTAAKKSAAKKTAAPAKKTTASKKTTATASKKTAASKKTVAKKTTAPAKKTTASKKPAAKKPAAKKKTSAKK